MNNNDLILLLQQFAKNRHSKNAAIITGVLAIGVGAAAYLLWKEKKNTAFRLQQSQSFNRELFKKITKLSLEQDDLRQQVENQFAEIEALKKDNQDLVEMINQRS